MSTEEGNQTEDLSITQLSNSGHSEQATKLITELNDDSMYGRVERKILELIDVLKNVDKLGVKQIKDILLNEVHFTSRSNIYNYLPDDMKRKYEHKPKQLEDREIQSIPTEDTDQHAPVYKEPDLVAPLPVTMTQDNVESIVESMPDLNTTNVKASEWLVHNQPTDYTVKARLNMRDNKKNMDFYVMLTVNCYPDKKTVEIEPIDKMAIQYIRPDQ